MRKLTNKQRIPKALADAVRQSASEYNNFGSNLSASSVLKPVRIYWLEKRYADEIESDVADNIWSFLGTATHYAAEKAGEKDKGTIAEERYFKDIDGWKFSAQIDNYEIKRKILTDFKITSVYSLKGDVKDDWVVQLNSQKLLMEEAGHPVEKLQICGIGRDWSKMGMLRDKDYPKHQVKLIKIPLWTNEKTQEFLEDRVELLKSYESTPDDELPECTVEERWATPAKYAVKKKGAKRATKLHECPKTAAKHATDIGGIVEERKGENKRCDMYCDVNRWCSTYKPVKGYPAPVQKKISKLSF